MNEVKLRCRISVDRPTGWAIRKGLLLFLLSDKVGNCEVLGDHEGFDLI